MVTNLTGISILFLLIIGALILLVPRRLAVIPLLIASCWMTLGQEIVFLGLNFTLLRIVLLMGLFRLIFKHDYNPIKINSIDRTLLWWVIFSVFAGVVLEPTSKALINRLGFAYNSLMIYFLFRYYISDIDDIQRVYRAIILIIIPLAGAFLFENSTGRNIFSYFGGVPEITVIRDGRLRCQGPFAHPILAGTFGATIIPSLLGLYFSNQDNRMLTIAGLFSASIITFVAASGGAVLAFCSGIIGISMWKQHANMKQIRWGILFVMIGLHLVMNAPVWFLVARLSGIVGGTGYHRSLLIDAAIRHFDEWWICGTKYTAHWMPYTLTREPNMSDITNQYIGEGVQGGILKMILFIAIITLSFRKVGLSLMLLKNRSFSEKILVWSLGSALLAHCISFISVTYFDQIIVFWYLVLSCISALPTSFIKSKIYSH